MGNEHSLSMRARKKIQAEREKAERERQIKLFKTRMEVARAGIIYYKNQKYKEALESYFQYLAILERVKKVKAGALEPRLFDLKKDAAELLLISGIYWDMAKLQDMSRRKEAKSQLKTYLDMFVKFSKGMPYQHMCAELVRKYLLNEKAQNKPIFKETHIRLGGGKCFVATALSDYTEPETIWRLRKLRDQKLLHNFFGRIFVRIYYRTGPFIALGVLKLPVRAQKWGGRTLDVFSKKVAH